MSNKNPSRKQLVVSQQRRLNSLMVRTLEKFEDSFPELDETRDGGIYKASIKAMFNDVIRAQRDELNDYEVEFKPLRLTDDNKLAMTRTLMNTVQRIEFGFAGEFHTPYMNIYANEDRASVMEAVRSEFDVGVLHKADNHVILSVVGIDDCISNVLTRMDKYRLHATVRDSYKIWRQRLVDMYLEP